LRDTSLTATEESLFRLAETHGRLLAASAEEIRFASIGVFDALQHSLIARVRQCERVHRELPITVDTGNGGIFEGVIDLAFLEPGQWVIADFKTDVDQADRQSRYRRQVGWYVRAMEQVTGVSVSGCVLHV